MSGFAVTNKQFTVQCPYCGTDADAEWKSTGSGWMQVGLFECSKCGAHEIGRYDHNEDYIFTEEEEHSGWYKPEFG
jgi:predicted RNA-binding Zn-ribbon protein involved in translation (DUF1610 family)